jgi:uncharacterized membrane protein
MATLGTFVFDNVRHGALWAVGIAAAAAWLVTAYYGIYRRTGRRLTWTLLALRALGLVALLVALARPVWTHESERVEPGRVAVVLDTSRSMSLADVDGRPRYERAREAARQLCQSLTAPPPRGEPALVADLFDILGNPLDGGPPAEPRADYTDIVRALSQTAAQLRSKPLAGIVLISDGMDNSRRQDFSVVEEVRVPVYAVGFRESAEAGHLDLGMRRVQAPERVLVNNAVKVGVLVEKSGGPAVEAAVAVKHGTRALAEQKVAFDAGAGERAVDLTFTPSEAGRFVFTVAVSGAGEKRLANNVQSFTVRVESEPIRVLYLEGFLRHEYKFLKNRFEDDPDVGLVSVVRRVNPELGVAVSGGDVITAERLEKFDVVMLGDMEAASLAPSEYDALVRWTDAGHALLVLGGYHSFSPSGFRTTPLAAMLPIVFADQPPFQVEAPFVLSLTDAGRRHPLFELSGDRVRDDAEWAGAPPLLGASRVQRAKPGADILAVNTNAVAGRDALPVVVVQRYGAGRVMVLAVDTTWQWSRITRVLGQTDTLFARFWSQAVRWLAGRNPADDRPPLVVGTDRPDYAVGQPVVVTVTRQPQATNLVGAVTVTADIVAENGQAVSVPMQAGSRDPDTFTGTFHAPAGGRYEVNAALLAGGKPQANQVTEFLVHGADVELADSGTSRQTLRAVASATGGLYYDIDDAQALAGKVERRDRRTVLQSRASLWNSPGLFVFFLAAVTLEWIVRRRHQLV